MIIHMVLHGQYGLFERECKDMRTAIVTTLTNSNCDKNLSWVEKILITI